ncbi:hypothetical protein DPMN_054725 [Dreissena polymorpha]|uniref:Uncharacterized protein n=1 Tax=Dreissena polymorpha TaxID=45954 RepID=A0A9D4CNM3_DREPO|nr:hypothetical protein DPMN_054725 [Dreissena polymorpha]
MTKLIRITGSRRSSKHLMIWICLMTLTLMTLRTRKGRTRSLLWMMALVSLY